MSVLAVGGTTYEKAHSVVSRRRRRLIQEPVRFLITLVSLAVLAALIAYPLLLLAKFSFFDRSGHFTLETIAKAFQQRGVVTAALNSLQLVGYVTAGCLALGIPLAWLTTRTDMPGKTLIRAAATIAFVVPSFITVIAWIFLAAPNSGFLNKLAISVFGLEGPPFNIVSFGGLVFIEVIHFFPLVFFAVSAALSNMDSSYEEAARVLGASRFRVAATITLPLVAPAILASSILCMLDTWSSFGAPATIGTMANFSVLTTKIYQLLLYPPKLEMAGAVSMPIIVYTITCLLIQRHFIRSDRYATLTGKVGAAHLTRLGRWRTPAFVACLVVAFCCSVLPLGGLITLSLLKTFGADITPANLELTHYRRLFDGSLVIVQAMQHSILLSALAASACLLLGLIFAWIVERTALIGRGAITFLIMLTYGFPSIAFGVGVVLGYIDLFYGTLTIIFIAYVAKKLPVSFVFLRNAIRQVAPNLEEASRVAGAGWLRTLFSITLPLLKASSWIAWVLVFSLCIRELPMSALLVQSGTEVMSTTIVQFIANGAVEIAAAISVVIVAFSVAVLLLVKRLSGRAPLEV